MTGTSYFIINTYTVMTLENTNFQQNRLHFTFSKMVHNIHINEGNYVLFIHFIGYHMADSTYEN